MATSTDEISVDIDALDAAAAATAAGKKANGSDPTAVTVEGAAPEAKPADKPTISPEEGIEALKKQLAAQTARADAAERLANDAAQGEAKARGDVQTSQLDLVKGAIERVTAESDALEEKYADALAAQDFKGAAKFQRQMSEKAAQLTQLEAGKVALEKAPKPVARAPVDDVEQFAAKCTPASAAWVRAHPEFVRDQHKNAQMIAAHQLALARGHQADTEEYFKSIEKTLDISPAVTKTSTPDPEEADPMADAAQPVRKPAPAAAPVSRSTNGSRPGVVKLSPAEVEIAESMGMTAEDYARNKMALKKEGKLQ